MSIIKEVDKCIEHVIKNEVKHKGVKYNYLPYLIEVSEHQKHEATELNNKYLNTPIRINNKLKDKEVHVTFKDKSIWKQLEA